MQLDDFSVLSYNDAIQTIRKWKIIPLKSFHIISPTTHTKSYSYKYIGRLEGAGIVRKMKLPRTNACVLLPSKQLMSDFNISISKEQFTHDTVVSYVAASFISLENFKKSEVAFEHEVEKFSLGSVIPDIQLSGVDPVSNDSFKIALEVELSRKAFSKIDDKLQKYIKDQVYDHVVYTFTSTELFDLFKMRILEWNESKQRQILQEKISLILIEDYLSFEKEIMNSRCFSNGKEGRVSDFF